MRMTKDHQKDLPTKYKPTIGGDVKNRANPFTEPRFDRQSGFLAGGCGRAADQSRPLRALLPGTPAVLSRNADLFANFGYATIRPFFSRRIGLGVPIQFGARMSGKINKNWRIGVLDVQTGANDTLTPHNNYAVFALQRQLLARSNVRFIFVNKDATNYTLERHAATNRYNRNIGAEFNLASAKNLWTGKVMFLKSFTPGKSSDDFTHAADLKFTKANFSWQWQHEYVGKNYNAEVGYVPNAVRMGYYKISPNLAYLFFIKHAKIISHGPKLVSNIYWDKKFDPSDREFILSYNLNFINRATVAVWGSSNYVRLLRPFDPTNLGGVTLATGTEHNWKAVGFDIVSGPQNRLTYLASGILGGYYQNGKRNNLKAEIGYRVQPYVAITMAGNYNDIRLPEPWKRTQLWLVGPRVDVTFTNSLFFTTFMQYNNQADNINLNARLQWRYKPASDLFIVYTDNYLPENFKVKNRAIVLKFTYWWNL